jgi:cytochrome b involved in lipid metabolism
MRKNLLISAVLTFALIAPVAPIANASQVKVGDKCKKVGRTITSGGSELVCKRDGKKRVWSAVAKTQPSAKPSATQSAAPSTSEAPATKGFTRAEVAAKNSNSACWTIVGNKVYDLTQWISRHPGGSSSIASLCGIDGTSRFRGQHGSSGRPNSQLDSYYIGDLKG